MLGRRVIPETLLVPETYADWVLFLLSRTLSAGLMSVLHIVLLLTSSVCRA